MPNLCVLVWISIHLPFIYSKENPYYRPPEKDTEALTWVNYLTIKGGFLNTTVLHSIFVSSVDICAYECSSKSNCFSFNLVQKSLATFNCQLCSSDRFYNWKDFVYNMDRSDHYGIDSLCWRRKSSCSQGDMCLPYYHNSSYQCVWNESANHNLPSETADYITFRGVSGVLIESNLNFYPEPSVVYFVLLFLQFRVKDTGKDSIIFSLNSFKQHNEPCLRFVMKYLAATSQIKIRKENKIVYISNISAGVWHTLSIRAPNFTPGSIIWLNGALIVSPTGQIGVDFDNHNPNLAIGDTLIYDPDANACNKLRDMSEIYEGDISNLYIAKHSIALEGLSFQTLMLLNGKYNDSALNVKTLYNLKKKVASQRLNESPSPDGIRLSVGQKFYVTVKESKLLESAQNRTMEMLHIHFYVRSKSTDCDTKPAPIFMFEVEKVDGTKIDLPIVIALNKRGDEFQLSLPSDIASNDRIKLRIPENLCTGTWNEVQINFHIPENRIQYRLNNDEVSVHERPHFKVSNGIVLRKIIIGPLMTADYTGLDYGSFFNGDLTMLQLTSLADVHIFQKCGDGSYTKHMTFDWTPFSFDNLEIEDINPLNTTSSIHKCPYLV